MNSSSLQLSQRVYTPLNALQAHAERLQAQSLSDLIGSDTPSARRRSSSLAFTFNTLHLDLSKQRVTQEPLS